MFDKIQATDPAQHYVMSEAWPVLLVYRHNYWIQIIAPYDGQDNLMAVAPRAPIISRELLVQ